MNDSKKMLIRTHGSPSIGLGHFYRTYNFTLAICKIDTKIKPIFMINQYLIQFLPNMEKVIADNFDIISDYSRIKEISPDIIVLDSYEISDNYLLEIRKLSRCIILFDDNNNLHKEMPIDILINGNIYAESLDYQKFNIPHLFLGPKYLILKEEYHTVPLPLDFDKKDGIMITTGGGDSHNLLLFFIEALNELRIKKRIIIGPLVSEEIKNKLDEYQEDPYIELINSPRSLLKYIDESALVITSAGSTIYEIIARKTPFIVFEYAENQRNNAIHLQSKGILNWGAFTNLKKAKIKEDIQYYYKNSEYLKALILLFNIIDDNGIFLIYNVLKKYF